ncbi:Ig-like domain-containing protein [Roseisolibacter sp. H3M3-2]|uniref:Ig-like domain-containing protein n=1 Tax=Roseisolibacter sp. H3M3-2 TaxID=3031323 RepID=UPI0023DBF61D|nr:Ig-like domain-containing protein [Roseisolibacter sp. H3M3-2]MDF1506179.1 Ig-like domain-containing protein [Roseisolibacter sp. H3M3-2]
MLRTVRRAAVRAALLLAVAACAESAPSTQPVPVDPTPREVTQVDIVAVGDAPLLVQGSQQLQARLRAADGRELDAPVAWASSDPAVVGVTPQGVVFGVAVGEAVVSATAGRGRAERRVVVAPPSVTALRLSHVEVTLAAGETHAFAAVALAADGRVLDDRPVVFRGSDDATLAVAFDGRVRGLRPGTAQLIAEVDGVRATARVTVTAGPLGDAPSRWSLRVAALAGAGVRCTLDGIAFRVAQSGDRVEGEFSPGGRVACAPVPGAEPPFLTPTAPHGPITGTIVGREVRLYATLSRWTFVGTLSADGRTLEGTAWHVGEPHVAASGATTARRYEGAFVAGR